MPDAAAFASEPPPGYIVLKTGPGWIPLALRLAVAGVFLVEGGRKFTDPMGQGIARFEAMGFPFPGFFAPLVGGFEVVCALLLVVGLGVRVAALPLATILLGAMAVLLTQGTRSVVFEGVLLGVCVVLLWAGAGRVSLDRMIWLQSGADPGADPGAAPGADQGQGSGTTG